MRYFIEVSLDESTAVKDRLKAQSDVIEKIAKKAVETIRNGGKIVLFGNGGSAADAQHIACELVGKFRLDREALPAIALTTNTSILTAIANDVGFEDVFSRQIQGLVNNKDLVIGISTSGESVNVTKGILTAKRKGAKTIVLTGEGGSKLAKVADISLMVPSRSTPKIQEAHITVGHIICELIEKEFSGK